MTVGGYKNPLDGNSSDFDQGLIQGAILGWELARHAIDLELAAELKTEMTKLLREIAEGNLTLVQQADALENGYPIRQQREQARRILAQFERGRRLLDGTEP